MKFLTVTLLEVSMVMAVSIMTANPLTQNPFSDILNLDSLKSLEAQISIALHTLEIGRLNVESLEAAQVNLFISKEDPFFQSQHEDGPVCHHRVVP